VELTVEFKVFLPLRYEHAPTSVAKRARSMLPPETIATTFL
jgi:hypothetical protein